MLKYQCTNCSFSTKKRLDFIIHSKIHGDSYLKCPVCPEFVKRSKFNVHVEFLHVIPNVQKQTPNFNVQCSVCMESFSDYNLLVL